MAVHPRVVFRTALSLDGTSLGADRYPYSEIANVKPYVKRIAP